MMSPLADKEMAEAEVVAEVLRLALRDPEAEVEVAAVAAVVLRQALRGREVPPIR
jgi:hypothetical protein